MPRHARLRIAGHPLHVIQRGVNRSACFGDEKDRCLYLALLEEIQKSFPCALHAYVLMTNHVHLLLTPEKPLSVSNLMKHLGQRYVQHFNRKYRRTGTLWEGRFRSSIIDSERYLLQCHRYIELNPVRAGMVWHPRDYPWSSYACNAEGVASSLVVHHRLYMSLGIDAAARLAYYRAQFGIPMSTSELQEIRDAANGGFALGRPGFLKELELELNRRVAPGPSGRPRRKTGDRPRYSA